MTDDEILCDQDSCIIGYETMPGVANCIHVVRYSLPKYNCVGEFGVIERELECVDDGGVTYDIAECEAYFKLIKEMDMDIE